MQNALLVYAPSSSSARATSYGWSLFDSCFSLDPPQPIFSSCYLKSGVSGLPPCPASVSLIAGIGHGWPPCYPPSSHYSSTLTLADFPILSTPRPHLVANNPIPLPSPAEGLSGSSGGSVSFQSADGVPSSDKPLLDCILQGSNKVCPNPKPISDGDIANGLNALPPVNGPSSSRPPAIRSSSVSWSSVVLQNQTRGRPVSIVSFVNQSRPPRFDNQDSRIVSHGQSNPTMPSGNVAHISLGQQIVPPDSNPLLSGCMPPTAAADSLPWEMLESYDVRPLCTNSNFGVDSQKDSPSLSRLLATALPFLTRIGLDPSNPLQKRRVTIGASPPNF
ncbi:hypothetical protein Nepgr_023263 [Nepenthes gracilis]|uniref:Uncharacterized protein n=1 Tax=Nepenthes gracilis TaxID=150966 RepID=A0AAD3XZ81_NEPGR|nr:hypothetical protein Nepgr_023263 [Nepenthes gracilis]